MSDEVLKGPAGSAQDSRASGSDPGALAQLYLQSGAYGEAESVLRKWIASDPVQSKTAGLLLIECLWRQGRLDEARALKGDLEAQHIHDIDIALMDIRLLVEAGEYRDAITKYGSYSDRPVSGTTHLQILFNVATCYARLNDPSHARQLFTIVQEHSTNDGWEEGSARSEMALAQMDRMVGDWKSAVSNLRSAKARYAKLGLLRGYVMADINLGFQQLWCGSLEEAEESLREAVRISIEMGDVRFQGSARSGLGLALVRQGRPQEARAELCLALRACRKQKAPRRLAVTLEYVGELHLTAGEPDKAERSLTKALRLAKDISPDGDIVPEVLRRLAEVSLQRGDNEKALSLAREAAERAKTLGDKYEHAVSLRVEGQALRQVGRKRDGNRVLAVALAQLEGLGERLERGRVLALLHPASRPGARPSDADLVALLERHGIVAASPPMLDLIQEAALAAPTQIPVLIRGETGTGKELLAHAIHKMGTKPGAPFIAFNCATCPPDLLDSELFGYERGAFTGAERGRAGLVRSAHGGTLFLDEIGELKEESQARLLRVLDSGEVRPLGSDTTAKVEVRIVAATHVDLERRIRENRFREDLYYRLGGMRLILPPLRDRGDDLTLLINRFVDEARVSLRPGFAGLGVGALRSMQAYEWPGNVRELRMEIQRLATLTPDGRKVTRWTPGGSAGLHRSQADLQTNEILNDAVGLADFLRGKSESIPVLARQLGTSRSHLYRMMQRHGIDPRTAREGGSADTCPS